MNNESSGWAKVDLSGQIISFEIDKPKISFEFNQFRLKYYDLNAYKNSSWFYYLSGFNQDKYFIYLMELYLMIMKNIQYVFIFQIILKEYMTKIFIILTDLKKSLTHILLRTKFIIMI